MYGTCTCNENELKKQQSIISQLSINYQQSVINYYEHVLLQVYALSFMRRNMAVIYCL